VVHLLAHDFSLLKQSGKCIEKYLTLQPAWAFCLSDTTGPASRHR